LIAVKDRAIATDELIRAEMYLTQFQAYTKIHSRDIKVATYNITNQILYAKEEEDDYRRP
jgi:hypothetical protein